MNIREAFSKYPRCFGSLAFIDGTRAKDVRYSNEVALKKRYAKVYMTMNKL